MPTTLVLSACLSIACHLGSAQSFGETAEISPGCGGLIGIKSHRLEHLAVVVDAQCITVDRDAVDFSGRGIGGNRSNARIITAPVLPAPGQARDICQRVLADQELWLCEIALRRVSSLACR